VGKTHPSLTNEQHQNSKIIGNINMTDKLTAIKEKLLAAKAKQKNTGDSKSKSTGDNAMYPFWNIPTGSTLSVRFLPDANPDNTFFWVNRETIKMPFAGVVGGDYPTDKEVEVTVPCVDMFNNMRCPIIAATKHLWDGGPEDEAIARRYWKKKSYIFQGFVTSSAMVEENAPENPIRRFVIGKMIYEVIENSLINPEFKHFPIDYMGGRDFNIMKGNNGKHAKYTSQWSFETRSLTDTETSAIDQYGLNDLSEYLGRRPDSTEMDAIKQMFEDSFAGKPFDYDSFGQYYRAYPSKTNNSSGGGASSAPLRAQPVGHGTTQAAFGNPSNAYAQQHNPVVNEAQQATVEQVSPVGNNSTAQASTSDAAMAAATQRSNTEDILNRIKQRGGNQ